MARRRGMGCTAVRAALAGAAIVLTSMAPARAASAADAGPAVTAPAAAAIDERSLGPVSTAAIGGVLVAGALWARARQRSAAAA